MIMRAIEEYFQSNIYKPFFAVVGDLEYRQIKKTLVEAEDVDVIRMSNYCSNADKKPNMDKLRETLRMADIDCESNKIVLLGLGEYLMLEGAAMCAQVLDELISFNLGSAHVVFLLRGVANHVRNMTKDPRLDGRQVFIAKETASTLGFIFSSMELGVYPKNGFRHALEAMEEGEEELICINTALDFPNSLLHIQRMKDSYEAICKKIVGFSVPKEMGEEDEWENLLKDITQEGSLNGVFQKYFKDDILSEFYNRISGSGYRSWVYYIYLYINKESVKNKYLQFVLEISNDVNDFRYKVMNAISSILHTESQFQQFYEERKRLISQYPVAEMAVFVSNNRFDPAESVYKLTDNTLIEREEIIADIAQHGIPTGLEGIYPDLALYLKKYHFQGDTLNEMLTEYFEEYKIQKVTNKLSQGFLQKVDQIAVSRDYNRLRTRDELVATIDKKGSFLCWVDALGVEYLGYIIELAHKRGLAVSVNVGRAELPTITGVNKQFYELWPDEHKRKIEYLDETKHHEKGGYKYGPSNLYSIHLAKELQIISDVIDEAATDLGLRRYERYVIASDHGASRLAVLRKKEEKYDTDTQGEHSGRCCKSFAGYDLPFATEENGYIVLADYGRFKGSRAANVEVHGGASLEEVLVPVIELSLRDDSIEIKMVEQSVKADYKTGVTITLFVNKSISQSVCVECNGMRYEGEAIDSSHYKVDIPEIKRACTLKAGIYLGDDLVSHIMIKAVAKSASLDSDFDDLF